MSENISEKYMAAEGLSSDAEDAVFDAAYIEETPNEAADTNGSGNGTEGSEGSGPDASGRKKKLSRTALAALILGGVILLGAAVFGGYSFCYKKFVVPAKKYIDAVGLYEEGHYADAVAAFSELGEYEDSDFLKVSAKKQLERSTAYQAADVLLSEGKYQEAFDAFTELIGFSDADERAAEIRDEYLTLAGQVRHAKVGDVIDLYNSDDDVIGSIKWRVIAEEDDRILLCEEYSSDELAMAYDADSMAGYWALDNGNIESTSCISKEVSPLLLNQGCFIPNLEFYNKYLAGNSSFSPSDGKAWIITDGEPLSAFTDETCTIRFNLYKVSYIGADGKPEGTMPGGNLLFRYFVWMSAE